MYASDAPEYGWGVTCSTWLSDQVATVGCVADRQRFKRSQLAPRAHAFDAAGIPLPEADAGRPGAPMSELDDGFDEALDQDLGGRARLPFSGEWVEDVDFPEVPAACLEEHEWEVLGAGRWTLPEDISVLESRALLRSVQQAVRSGARDRRILFLVDNLGVCLAFARARSRVSMLLQLIRKMAAWTICFGIAVALRWIPSEFNSSDSPSRRFDPNPQQQVGSVIFRHRLPWPLGKGPAEQSSLAVGRSPNEASPEPVSKGPHLERPASRAGHAC